MGDCKIIITPTEDSASRSRARARIFQGYLHNSSPKVGPCEQKKSHKSEACRYNWLANKLMTLFLPSYPQIKVAHAKEKLSPDVLALIDAITQKHRVV